MLKGVCDCCHFYRDNVRLLRIAGFDLGYVCFDCFKEMMCEFSNLKDELDNLDEIENLTIILKDKGVNFNGCSERGGILNI